MFQDTNQLWILSDIMALHRDAACSKTRFCLNQDLTYLFTVLSLKHYDLHAILKFFEVCAHAKIFPSFSFQSSRWVLVYYQIYLENFTVSFPNCILLSPLYANALPGCLCYHPSIYLLIGCDLRYSLASYSQIPFCLLSMPDDPFITQPCFTISPDNALYLLTIPLAFSFSFVLLITSCRSFLSNDAFF